MSNGIFYNHNNMQEIKNIYFNKDGHIYNISNGYYNDGGTIKKFWSSGPVKFSGGKMTRIEIIGTNGIKYWLYTLTDANNDDNTILTLKCPAEIFLVGGGGGGMCITGTDNGGISGYDYRLYSGGGGQGGDCYKGTIGPTNNLSEKSYKVKIGKGGNGAKVTGWSAISPKAISYEPATDGGDTGFYNNGSWTIAAGGLKGGLNGVGGGTTNIYGCGGGGGVYLRVMSSSFQYTLCSGGYGRYDTVERYYPFYLKLGDQLKAHGAGGAGGSATWIRSVSGSSSKLYAGGKGGSLGVLGSQSMAIGLPQSTGDFTIPKNLEEFSANYGGGRGGYLALSEIFYQASSIIQISYSEDDQNINGENGAKNYGAGGGGGALGYADYVAKYLGNGGNGGDGVIYLLIPVQ